MPHRKAENTNPPNESGIGVIGMLVGISLAVFVLVNVLDWIKDVKEARKGHVAVVETFGPPPENQEPGGYTLVF